MTEVLSRDSIGLIAGSRELPFLFAEEAKRHRVKRIVAVGFEGETDPALAERVDELIWVKVGQLGKLIQAFVKRGVAECVMLGQVAPKNLYLVRPDLRGASLLFRLKEKNAHTIFGGIADELAKDGVTLVTAAPWMERHMPAGGLELGKPVSSSLRQEIAFGLKIAREMGRLEVGQLAIVKEGSVLAVEGFEGTDECLKRGGILAGPKGGAVAVKIAKDDHDMRFDIPCVGYRTFEVCHEAGIRVLAIEGGRSLLLERPRWETELRRWGISFLTVSK